MACVANTSVAIYYLHAMLHNSLFLIMVLKPPVSASPENLLELQTMGLTRDPLNQKLWGGAKRSGFQQALQGILTKAKV